MPLKEQNKVTCTHDSRICADSVIVPKKNRGATYNTYWRLLLLKAENIVEKF